MRFLADESVDAPIIEMLRANGHDVDSVAELVPSTPDDVVFDRANHGGALLLTGDKDFGEIVFRLHRISLGVILIRLSGLSAPSKARIVAEAIRTHGEEMKHAFTVISPGMVRIRREA